MVALSLGASSNRAGGTVQKLPIALAAAALIFQVGMLSLSPSDWPLIVSSLVLGFAVLLIAIRLTR
jgi:hypothetical protein